MQTNSSSQATSSIAKKKSFGPAQWGVAVLVLGIFISATIAYKIHVQNINTLQQLAETQANLLADQISERIKIYAYGLHSIRGHILTKGEQNTQRSSFEQLMQSRNIEEEFPGALGLGFIRRVPAEQEADYLLRARADGMPEFTIHQFAEHTGERYVFEYLAPVAVNRRAIGFDIASERARREAAELAMRTGEIQLTAPITLVQAEGKTQQSFLILMPIYRTWQTPATEPARIEAALGWSVAPLIMEQVLAELAFNKQDFLIQLADVTERDNSSAKAIVFHTNAGQVDLGNEVKSLLPHQQVKLEVYGRQWRLDFTMSPAFILAQRLPEPKIVFLWGLVLSTLIAMLVSALRFYLYNRQKMINQQARLAAIVQHSNDAIIVTRTDDSVLNWNKGAESLFGYTEKFVLNKKLIDLILPEGLKQESDWLIARLKNGEYIPNYETQRQHKNGKLIDVALNYSPLRDEKGSIIGFSKTIRNISSQKAAQKKILELNHNLEQQVNERTLELKNTNQMLNNLLKAATKVSIIATDLNGTITVFNSGAEQMLGYQADELIGKQSPVVLHHPDELSARSRELSEYYGEPIEGFRIFTYPTEREAAYTRQWTYLRKDGESLQVSLSVSAMRSPEGELLGYLGVALDITQAEHNKRELIGARDQLAIAANIAGLGVWSLDLATEQLSWNDNMFTIYDQPLALRDTGLSYQHWRERLHPEDRESTEQLFALTMEGTHSFHGTFRLLLPDNSVRFIQAAADCEKDANNKVVRIIGINRDITGQQKLEDYLREAKQKADDASAAKSSFLANMSHEIRTPMNAVLGMLHLVQKTALNHRQQDYIIKAESSARSLLGLLNDILDFSKMDAGKLSLDIHPFELEGLMRDLGVLLAANHGDKNVEVLFEIDPQLPKVIIADRLRLQQVLTNLASNALKFTHTGHVLIAIQQLEASATQVRLRFAISDSGIGISEEQQLRIFNGFEQAESSTTRRFGGTGLGLVISKRLVSMMGGELQLSSTLGAGSKFWFDVNLSVADATPYTALDPSCGARIRVLIVDDSPLATQVLQQTLEQQGFITQVCNSGLEAVEQVTQAQTSGAPFDVILMDWSMPDIDGFSAAQLIHSHSQPNTQPIVIMVTAYEREVLAQQGQLNGVYSELLTKPVTPHQLAQSIWQNFNGKPFLEEQKSTPEYGAQPLAGLSLLVVEDNALNRQVAQELLEGAGARVDLAEGGLEGLAKATSQEHHYDLVLMDIQMPDLDGYETTRRIRAQLGSEQLPILAMTANASAADKEACLAAGMNAHTSKPIDIEQLINSILHLLSRPTAQLAELDQEQNGQLALVDSRNLILKRFGNNQALFARMLSNFHPEVSQLLDKLARSYPEQHWAEAQAALHSIKGVASTLGAKALAEHAAALELRCKQTEPDQLHQYINQSAYTELVHLLAQSDALLAEIALSSSPQSTHQAANQQAHQQERPGASSRGQTGLSDAQLRLRLRELIPVLEADNLGAVDLIDALCDAQPNHPQLQQLAQLIDSLAYPQALSLIQELLAEPN